MNGLPTRGIQDDGITNDATGSEDFSPDFFWDFGGKGRSGGMDRRDPHPVGDLAHNDRQFFLKISYAFQR